MLSASQAEQAAGMLMEESTVSPTTIVSRLNKRRKKCHVSHTHIVQIEQGAGKENICASHTQLL